MSGKVKIGWTVNEDVFELTWQSGGPPAAASKRRGLGSKLLAMGIAGSHDVSFDYGTKGLRPDCGHRSDTVDAGRSLIIA